VKAKYQVTGGLKAPCADIYPTHLEICPQKCFANVDGKKEVRKKVENIFHQKEF